MTRPADWDFPTAFRCWDRREQEAINRVMVSGRFTIGHEVEQFEGEFAAYHGRKHAIMVNSGSSANLVAVAAIREHHDYNYTMPDGFAGVPAVAWATTYAPLVQLRYDLIVRDVDNTWNAPIELPKREWHEIEVVCSVLGNSADLSAAYNFCDQRLSILLEDNCESLGARTPDGRLTGTFGDLSTFSFFHSHQLSAIEGGMVTTDDDDLARLCRRLRNHGNAGWGEEDFENSYRFELFGFNVRPLEMHAAIAREQLKKLDGFVAARRANLEYFTSLVKAKGVSATLQKVVGSPSPFGLAFCCEDNAARRRLVPALRAARIDCRLPTGGSFLRHPYAAPWRDQSTPHADRIHDTGLFLGNAPWDISDLVEKAVQVMRSVL